MSGQQKAVESLPMKKRFTLQLRSGSGHLPAKSSDAVSSFSDLESLRVPKKEKGKEKDGKIFSTAMRPAQGSDTIRSPPSRTPPSPPCCSPPLSAAGSLSLPPKSSQEIFPSDSERRPNVWAAMKKASHINTKSRSSSRQPKTATGPPSFSVEITSSPWHSSSSSLSPISSNSSVSLATNLPLSNPTPPILLSLHPGSSGVLYRLFMKPALWPSAAATIHSPTLDLVENGEIASLSEFGENVLLGADGTLEGASIRSWVTHVLKRHKDSFVRQNDYCDYFWFVDFFFS